MGTQPTTPPPADTAAEDTVTPVDHANIVAALAAAQGAFPAIAKTHTATVTSQKGSYDYKYADLADVLAAVRPVLSRNGLAVTQRTVRGASGMMLVTELRHTSGEVIETEVELGASPSNHQQFGGALTYLRRYELATLLGIAPEQDLDAQDVDAGGPAAAPSLPAWAQPATYENTQGNLKLIARIIGREKTAELAAMVKAKVREPALAGGIVYAMGELAAMVIGELDPLALEDAAAKRDAAQAQAAAEEPDAPAPEPQADPPPADDETAAAIAAAQEAGVDVSDVDLEPVEAEDVPPAEEAKAAPASVPMPELADDATPVEQIKALRAAGCTCESPITADENQRDGACPIITHGIPF